MKIGFLGGGRMATAMRDGLLRGGQPARDILVCGRPGAALPAWEALSCVVAAEAADLFASSEVLVLAVKPQVYKSVGAQCAGLHFAGQLVVSIMAGITLQTLEGHFPGVPLVRTMPNTPMMKGEGMTALCMGRYATPEHLALVEQLFAPVSRTLRVEEGDMDAVTAISGSGPAYAFLLAEAVGELAAELGLERAKAILLWSQTMRGAAAMLDACDQPQELRRQVTSPGGTTEAALRMLADEQFAERFKKGLRAAVARSRQLGGPI